MATPQLGLKGSRKTPLALVYSGPVKDDPGSKFLYRIQTISRETNHYFGMSDDWVEQRDRAVLNTVYYCETCNIIIELGDADVSIPKRDLPLHKLRRVMILRCSRCGNVVTDSYAQYSPEKNQFWCKNCISEAGVSAFHSA